MKKYIYLLLLTIFIGACNEDKFLKETPLDFNSGNNSYSTATDFDLAINELYYLTRYEFYCNGDHSIDFLYGTDLVSNGSSAQANLASDLSVSGSIAQSHWDNLYKLIAQSNTVMSRLPGSNVGSDEQVVFQAKARFFRGLAYRTLVYLYGGVPLQLEEVTSPKTDYVRSTRDETLQQAIDDVKFAAENLPDITAVKDGEVSSPAAYHLLSELYLAVNQYQNAVDAATKVISNPSLALMKDRFGSRATETPGDVYWDLYRTNNQNRSTYGNTEGIFVIQMETDVTGGGSKTSYYFWDNPGNYLLERHCAPQTGLFRMTKNGVTYAPFDWPVGDYTGGRGIGTAVPTEHFENEIWASDFNNDIRNANHNFVRKFAFNHPTYFASGFDAIGGDSIDVNNPPAGMTFLTGLNNQSTFPGRYLYGYQTKCSQPYGYPAALYDNPATFKLKSTGGGAYTDQYMFRLAETYLIRAEAYLGLDNSSLAAADINEVRSRANASPVAAADVTLDYILDERIRELGIEERRRLTLGRLGTDIFYNRVIKYNPYYTSNEADGQGFLKKYTLYPIPLSAIEANKDAVLEQNPDY